MGFENQEFQSPRRIRAPILPVRLSGLILALPRLAVPKAFFGTVKGYLRRVTAINTGDHRRRCEQKQDQPQGWCVPLAATFPAVPVPLPIQPTCLLMVVSSK